MVIRYTRGQGWLCHWSIHNFIFTLNPCQIQGICGLYRELLCKILQGSSEFEEGKRGRKATVVEDSVLYVVNHNQSFSASKSWTDLNRILLLLPALSFMVLAAHGLRSGQPLTMACWAGMTLLLLVLRRPWVRHVGLDEEEALDLSFSP